VMSAEVLEVGWLCVTLVEMTSASERARPAAQLRRSPITLSLTPFSSAHARLVSRQSSLRTRQRLHSSLRALALSPCARALSSCACAHGMHTSGMRARRTEWQHDILNGMDTGHGHRDGMDTSTHETRS